MSARRHLFAPRELCAIAPRALGAEYDEPAALASEARGSVFVVPVRGPLMHHPHVCFDSYDALRARVGAALEAGATAVVLAIDSPGGLVSGCFDTARDIRAACDRARVPLYAYVDGHAVSAAYALACAASLIVLPEAGVVGSVGVIEEVCDLRGNDAQAGVAVRVYASGARKTDRNAHVAPTDAAAAAIQGDVDQLAELFAHVARARGVSVEQVRDLEAGMVIGATAVGAGLADAVMTFDEMIGALAGGTLRAQPASNPTGEAMTRDEMRAALRTMAEGDGEEAAWAKKMLAAEDDGGDSDEGKEEPKGEDGDDDPKAEGDDDQGDDAPEKKESEASARGGASARSGAAGTQASAGVAPTSVVSLAVRIEKLEAEREAAAREKLAASRPDLGRAFFAALASLPLADVRTIVKATPKRAGLAIDTGATGTQGETQGGQGQGLTGKAADDLALRMGLGERKPVESFDGWRHTVGVMRPARKEQ